jgi:hypothetical protein
MNARECTEANLGVLLHAYEVGGLSEEDIERFEIHMLRCDRCFEAVQSFAPWAELMRADGEIRRVVQEADGESLTADTRRGRWGRYLWPPWPLPFRPAVIYILVLILLYPAYQGLHPSSTRSVENIQAVTLIPSRSAAAEGVIVQSGRDAAITFVFRGAQPDKRYQVRLADDAGEVVFTDDAFTDFDRYETGQVLFPAERMRPGGYLLEIVDPEGNPPQNRQAYHFEVRP